MMGYRIVLVRILARCQLRKWLQVVIKCRIIMILELLPGEIIAIWGMVQIGSIIIWRVIFFCVSSILSWSDKMLYG